MNRKDRHLLDCCRSLLTNFGEESSLTDKELEMVDKAIQILLHVRYPKSILSREKIAELRLEPINHE